jgi:hypothetical protein
MPILKADYPILHHVRRIQACHAYWLLADNAGTETQPVQETVSRRNGIGRELLLLCRIALANPSEISEQSAGHPGIFYAKPQMCS